ncbi:hypothetical protein [Helicobacter felis]|uniref:hypothetical protein n=1 Tax=Helicobacter felis TaxID=214 RepID=UPI000CF0BF6D|nr:hypothetical protein [Helicobacter felis]
MPSKNGDYYQVKIGLWDTEGDFKNCVGQKNQQSLNMGSQVQGQIGDDWAEISDGDYVVVNASLSSCPNEPKMTEPTASDWVEVDLFNDGNSYKK